MNQSKYSGKVYLAPSGQWGFKFYENGVEMGGGAGFETKAEAIDECEGLLCSYADGTLDERFDRIEVVRYEDLPALT